MDVNYGLDNDMELHYRNIQPKIMATKYIENMAGDLYDFKFYCFDGVPKYIFMVRGRFEDERTCFYDTNWNMQDFYYLFGKARKDDEVLDRPKQLEEAVKLAGKLSSGFSFARVDLYLLETGEIYFGEMTFTPLGGKMRWMPDMEKTDKYLGSLINLPKEKYILK